MIKVAVNGYGTIGKRISDAVAKQPDMELEGVTKTSLDFESETALEKGFDLYAATEKGLERLGSYAEGHVSDLLEKTDLVFDCSPGGVGKKNKSLYKDKNIKTVFQGGENHEVAGLSFNSTVNFEEAKGRDAVRVVSCNTTGLCRTLYPLHKEYGLTDAVATLVRRGGDPKQTDRGPINSIIPSRKIPSHHGPDLEKVIPEIKLKSLAVKVPTTLMHLHSLALEFEETPETEEVKKLFESYPRIMLINGEKGMDSTAEVCEKSRDILRPRYDVWETVVWKDSLSLHKGKLCFFQAVHQESIVVPENIDAARALTGETGVETSMKRTNQTLGIEDVP